MEQSAPSPAKLAIKWSLIYLLVAIVITYIFEIAKLNANNSLKYLGYIPLIAFLILAQKEYKDRQGGYIKFGDAFLTGLLYGLFTGVLFGIFIAIYFTVLSPEIFAQTIDSQRDAMAAKGNLTSDQIDQGIEFAKKFGAYVAAFIILFLYFILGIVVGLIGAAVFKKERSPFDPEPTAL